MNTNTTMIFNLIIELNDIEKAMYANETLNKSTDVKKLVQSYYNDTWAEQSRSYTVAVVLKHMRDSINNLNKFIKNNK